MMTRADGYATTCQTCHEQFYVPRQPNTVSLADRPGRDVTCRCGRQFVSRAKVQSATSCTECGSRVWVGLNAPLAGAKTPERSRRPGRPAGVVRPWVEPMTPPALLPTPTRRPTPQQPARVLFAPQATQRLRRAAAGSMVYGVALYAGRGDPTVCWGINRRTGEQCGNPGDHLEVAPGTAVLVCGPHADSIGRGRADGRPVAG